MMKSLAMILLVSAVVLISGCVQGEFQLTPKGGTGTTGPPGAAGTEVGTGWSVNDDPEEAAKEAVEMALEGKTDKKPDFAIIFASAGSDVKTIVSKAVELLGNQVKIYGGSSSARGVMNEMGFVNTNNKTYAPESKEGKKGIVVMTVSSKDIVFGTGAANISTYSSTKEAAKAAVLDAIKSAGKNEDEAPKIILVTPTRLVEEDSLEGIEEIVGKDTVIIGGTAGGPPRAVFDENDVYVYDKDSANEGGISLAVVYTDLPIGWVFEGGFDVTDPHSGIVTKAEGQEIMEIDNRPALDVYDEWLNGEITKLYASGGDERMIRDLLTLHPLYRKYTSSSGQTYQLFSHPWAKDFTLKEKSVMTSTKIKTGEKVYVSHGAWETLLNRIGNLPKKAKSSAGIDINAVPVLGIGYVCNGVMGVIPETERNKMPILINYANKNAPFISTFTSGEQGHFAGVGNRHGNLLTSFIVIGQKK